MTDYLGESSFDGASAPSGPLGAIKPELVNLAGRRWLVGMTWHTYESVLHRSELLDEAEVLKADWIARRAGEEVVQVGYCQAAHNAWPNKLFSLSALLADSHKVPWAGAFDLGDGRWWYIAVRDNYTIMPEGDVVGSYDDILRARQEHASIEDFSHVDGTREDLEELILRSSGRRTPIESITRSRFTPKQIISAAVCAAIVLVATSGFLYWQHAKSVREQALRIARAKVALKSQPVTQQPAAPSLEAVLRSTPDPAAWLAACSVAVHSRPLWYMGWQLAGQHCNDKVLTVRWRRRNSATIAYMPPGVMDQDGNGDTETVALSPSATQGTVAALPLGEARNRMIFWGQLHNIVVHFTPGSLQQTDMSKPSVTPSIGSQPVPPPMPTYTIDFTVNAAPFALNFDGLVGLRITSAELQPGGTDPAAAGADPTTEQVMSGTWKLKGVLYGR